MNRTTLDLQHHILSDVMERDGHKTRSQNSRAHCSARLARSVAGRFGAPAARAEPYPGIGAQDSASHGLRAPDEHGRGRGLAVRGTVAVPATLAQAGAARLCAEGGCR